MVERIIKETFQYFIAYSVVLEQGDNPAHGNIIVDLEQPLDNVAAFAEVKDVIIEQLTSLMGKVPHVALISWKRLIDLSGFDEEE